eukprot:12921622-Prorocentrum_lima.AAC.1
MHPSMWLLIKGPRPKDQQVFAYPAPPDTFAATHTWIKGSVKGKIAISVDDLPKAGGKASNLECLKALNSTG